MTPESLDPHNRSYDLPGFVSRESCEAAYQRIKKHIVHTPLEACQSLSEHLDTEILLKLENLQTTGSFKLRGVLNSILSLSEVDLRRPLVAASSGNHGAAFAYALETFDLSGRLFSPRTISDAKLDWLQRSGIQLELVGDDTVEAEMAARTYAETHGCVLIPPYNHPAVVAGQSTIGVELMMDTTSLDAVLVPVGGGGLISGIGSYIKAVSPSTTIIGCQPTNSPIMYHSVQAGKIVEEESLPTLADGTAGGIEPGTITFDLCQEVVDEFVLVSEEEIAAAMIFMRKHCLLDIEGAAALSIAAAIKLQKQLRGKRTALIVSGARVNSTLIDELEKSYG
jgi:threonine dehydratase